MDIEEFRTNSKKVIDWICDYHQNLRNATIANTPSQFVDPASVNQNKSDHNDNDNNQNNNNNNNTKGFPAFPVAAAVQPNFLFENRGPVPSEGSSFASIFESFQKDIFPGITHWQHPNFYAYFPAQTSFPAMYGDMLSSGLGVNGMMWVTSPAATELEMIVCDWMAKIIGLPEIFHFGAEGQPKPVPHRGGGVIQGTASEAGLVALVAARHRVVSDRIQQVSVNKSEKELQQIEEDLFSKLLVYTSDQTHTSIKKAAIVAGIPLSRVRVIPTKYNPISKKNLTFDISLLKSQIELDKKMGLIPTFLGSTLGTTATGAFDDIEELAKICQEEKIWLHVDAAWAGSMLVCPEHRSMLKGIEHVDSFCFNPHKMLMTTFDCSLFYVQDRTVLTSSASVTATYYKNSASESKEVIDYREWQVPLGRRFRSLKLFFVLKTFGVENLAAQQREFIKISEKLEQMIREDDRFELAFERSLTLIVFRLKPQEGAKNQKDATKELVDHLNRSGKVLLTPIQLEGQTYIRFSIGTPYTTLSHVQEAWAFIQSNLPKLN